MLAEVRQEIVRHAIRWTNNVLVEVLSNHGAFVPPRVREAMHEATSALSVAQGLQAWCRTTQGGGSDGE